MKKISKSAAIKQAKSIVGKLHKFGDGYKFLTWNEEKQSWMDGGAYPYWLASWKRSQAMLDIARDLLGKPWQEYTGVGKWTDSV